MDRISPLYQMSLINSIHKELDHHFASLSDIENYLKKWHEEDDMGWENFHILTKKIKDNWYVIDVEKTLHSIDGELLLKIAIELGIETPDYIPSIPTFRNELKSSYETASQTFEKAFRIVESDPSLAIGLTNSALEAIIKKILSDERIPIINAHNETLSKLIGKICKAFRLCDPNCPSEVKTIGSSLVNTSKAIEDLRCNKTEFHGKEEGDLIINDPLYAYFVINSCASIGLFLMNFYRLKYPTISLDIQQQIEDDLPF